MALHPCLGSMWWEFDSPLADHFECAPVAQWIRRLTTDQKSGSSSLSGRTMNMLASKKIFKIMLAKRRNMMYS